MGQSMEVGKVSAVMHLTNARCTDRSMGASGGVEAVLVLLLGRLQSLPLHEELGAAASEDCQRAPAAVPEYAAATCLPGLSSDTVVSANGQGLGTRLGSGERHGVDGVGAKVVEREVDGER